MAAAAAALQLFTPSPGLPHPEHVVRRRVLPAALLSAPCRQYLAPEHAALATALFTYRGHGYSARAACIALAGHEHIHLRAILPGSARIILDTDHVSADPHLLTTDTHA